MIDLHCHILPGIDDGAADLSVSLEMARLAVANGVETQACTPHILPGLYHNTGPQIRAATLDLQRRLDDGGVPLRLIAGADAHLTPDMPEKIRSGLIPSLGGTRYVLVEPPHHVAPPHLDDFFFRILVAGYVPILTHPERLTWIETHYPAIVRLFEAGVWMQITAGSLLGAFGRRPLYWAERMLNEGRVHILATDAHGVGRRRPVLAEGRDAAAKWVGAQEARRLVADRPAGILTDLPPTQMPAPRFDSGAAPGSMSEKTARAQRVRRHKGVSYGGETRSSGAGGMQDGRGGARGLVGRLRSFFSQ
jgi:protein-tyrosine phosphatase